MLGFSVMNTLAHSWRHMLMKSSGEESHFLVILRSIYFCDKAVIHCAEARYLVEHIGAVIESYLDEAVWVRVVLSCHFCPAEARSRIVFLCSPYYRLVVAPLLPIQWFKLGTIAATSCDLPWLFSVLHNLGIRQCFVPCSLLVVHHLEAISPVMHEGPTI